MNQEFKTSLGNLTIDKIIVDCGYPLLFVCKDITDTFYLFSQPKSDYICDKWMVANISPETILLLLTDKITMRDAFLDNKDPNKRFSLTNFFDGKIIEKYNDPYEWGSTSVYLPSENEYLDADFEEFSSLISYFKKFVKEEETS